jgi:O-antigen/teichoic acid export membrane protein
MKEFEKYSILVFLLSMLGNISNYFFQIIMGRMLDVDLFGILNSLYSFYAIISMPVSVILIVVSKYVSENKALNKNIILLIKIFFFYVFIFLIFYLSCGIALSGFIASFINVDSKYLVSFVIIAAGFGIILPVATGGLQGEKKFFAFGIVNLVFPLTKLFGSIIFVLLGFELNGIILSLILGNIFAILLGLRFLNLDFKSSFEIVNIKFSVKAIHFVWITFLVNIGMTIFTNIDVIIVKHYFSNEATGFYSVASILGKMILYISSSIVFVMFPFMTEASVRKDDVNNILKKALLYGGVLSAFCALGLNIFTKQVILILFGSKYMDSTIYILPVSLWVIIISFINILTSYFLAINHAKLLSASLVVGFLISFVLFHFLHNGILQIIYVLAAVSFGIFILNILQCRKRNTIVSDNK